MLFMDFKFGIAGSCGGCPYSPEAGGLLFCSVGVCVWPPASERVSFRQINKQTGNRLRQQLVDEVTREVVEAHDKGRGYEIAKGQYLQVEDDEIDAIQVESTHAIEIEKFVPLAEIDVRYFDNPYYLIPDDQVGLDAFAVVRDAMASKKMVGVGRVVLQKRERPILLEPFGKGIRGMTLRYPYEVRGETEYFEDIPELKIAPDMLKLAQHIVYKSRSLPAGGVRGPLRGRAGRAAKDEASGSSSEEANACDAASLGANIFDLLRRSVNLEAKSKKTKAPPLQPAMAKKKAGTKQRARA
jgi:DNA end-binding protein Ku